MDTIEERKEKFENIREIFNNEETIDRLSDLRIDIDCKALDGNFPYDKKYTIQRKVTLQLTFYPEVSFLSLSKRQ